MKFSYWRSERMTPIGVPEQTSKPSLTVQVPWSVLTFTHPARSLPLNRSRNSPAESGSAANPNSRHRAVTLISQPVYIRARLRGNGRLELHPIQRACEVCEQV